MDIAAFLFTTPRTAEQAKLASRFQLTVCLLYAWDNQGMLADLMLSDAIRQAAIRSRYFNIPTWG